MNKNHSISLSKPDFFNFITSKLRICSKNLFLHLKMSDHLTTPLPHKRHISPFPIPKRVHKRSQLLLSDKSPFTPPTEVHNCFMLFLVKSLRNLLPDIEIIKFKQTCLNIISTLDTPSEGHFGLAKIYCYEGRFSLALQQLRLVLQCDPNDISYLIWTIVIKTLCMKTKKNALKVKSLCDKVRSCRQERVEVYWAMMRIAQSGLIEVGKDIESPEHYASKIYTIDTYYGYLAWSQLSSDRKSVRMLNALVKSYPARPEAFIKLWNYNYYIIKDYQASISIIQSAYLSIKQMKDYEVLISINYAKTLYNSGNIGQAIELLQIEYTKHSVYIVYLYHYARLCVKGAENMFLGSAVGALNECLKICSESRHGYIQYWLAKAYMRLNERILCFKSIHKSLSFFSKSSETDPDFSILCPKATQKLAELKQMLSKCCINSNIFNRAKDILRNFDSSMIEEFSTLVKSVKESDELYGEILESQALWKFDYKDDALKALYSGFKTTRVQMKSFFWMVRFLREESDYMNIKKICEKMIKRCRSPSIPVQVWLKVHLIFAKALIKLNNIPKAILIYKCLAQVQPAPYIPDLLYTRILQKATTIEDLINTPQIVAKFKDSKANEDLNFRRVQLLSSKRNLSSLIIGDGDEDIYHSKTVCNEDNQLLGSRTPEPLPKARFSKTPIGDNANPGFSVCIYYLFLYKIGKASAKFKVNVEDGLLAMHDFLIMHHYWMKEGIETDEKVKVKAIYWMGVLYHHCEQYQQAAQTFKECLCMLFQLGLTEMSEKVQIALKEYRVLGCN